MKIGIGKTQEVYRAIYVDLGNKALQKQYQGLWKEIVVFIANLKYPENFIDTLVLSA